MKVAAVQLDIAWEDRQANFARVRQFAKDASELGADLLVLPEMFSTGFSMNPDRTAEDEAGPTRRFLSDIARENRLYVLGGLVLRGKGNHARNMAMTFDREGQELSRYTKTHLFSHMGEDRHHEAGSGPTVFEMEGIDCSCFICYDLRFPEIFRQVADACQLVFVIASWPAARQHHWDTLLRARAIENQIFVVGVNRIGTGGGLDYEGGTAVISPNGALCAEGGSRETLVIADIAPEQVRDLRQALPFLKDKKV